ncbi:GntR family transcriptional regulator [Paenibacillus filicis]|uniref:GntR family transcriptional regulator n=1 Tax=Paenibacillus gyeongsangnamensis TaxID=3388067 RepID=A0ABT4Q9Q8_9BACL|nr:GntR family transcriptional regulator [Paenibacillus filicis]MCZ8513619.1 GntR family transcriptional regulator [Paenibacillus filicis]
MQNDRKALYVQIQEYFKARITSGELKENAKIPSEKELMEQFAVSRITVANALGELAKGGWIYRIPGRGSFVGSRMTQHRAALEPPVADQPPSSSQRRMIGLIMPYIPDYFAVRLIEGIQSVFKGSDYYLLIALTNNSKEREKEAILELIRKGAAGLLIFPADTETYNEEILALKLRNYPFVLIDRYLPGIDTHYVCSDGYLGTQLAVNHLWDLGHRSIAICTDSVKGTVTAEDRIAGYMDALKDKGALINPSLILREFDFELNGPQEDHPLFRYVKSRMATAYITLHNQLALFIAAAAKRLHLRVPEDISIVSFDDPSVGLEDYSSFSHVFQNEKKMGAIAAQNLLDVLKEPAGAMPGYRMVTITPELMVKQTTAPVSNEAHTGAAGGAGSLNV